MKDSLTQEVIVLTAILSTSSSSVYYLITTFGFFNIFYILGMIISLIFLIPSFLIVFLLWVNAIHDRFFFSNISK